MQWYKAKVRTRSSGQPKYEYILFTDIKIPGVPENTIAISYYNSLTLVNDDEEYFLSHRTQSAAALPPKLFTAKQLYNLFNNEIFKVGALDWIYD